jgi:acyl-CoA thioester hydrolase
MLHATQHPNGMPSSPALHRTDIQVRFADTDAQGHLNNGSYAIYAETARLAFFRDLGNGVGSLILAHLAIDFRQQVRFGSAVAVETWVERIGTTSVTLRHAIRADDEVAADVRSVVVRFDYETQRPTAWSETMRAALTAHTPAVHTPAVPAPA